MVTLRFTKRTFQTRRTRGITRVVFLSALLTHGEALHLNHVFEILCNHFDRHSSFETELLREISNRTKFIF